MQHRFRFLLPVVHLCGGFRMVEMNTKAQWRRHRIKKNTGRSILCYWYESVDWHIHVERVFVRHLNITSWRLVISHFTCRYACLRFKNILAFYKYSLVVFLSVAIGLELDFPVMIIIFFQLRTAAFKAYCAILDVPTFATRRLHVCHHARAPSRRRWNCGREMSGSFA
jgi:hypothetical protein